MPAFCCAATIAARQTCFTWNIDTFASSPRRSRFHVKHGESWRNRQATFTAMRRTFFAVTAGRGPVKEELPQ
jgi:hypothetical protein